MNLDDLSMTDLTSQPGVMTPKLRPLDFEAFPAEIRLKIYRLLLLKISNLEDEDEYEANSGRINGELILDRFEEGANLYPVMMRLNKRIHSEAAPVFWGENYFTWSIYGDKCRPMWHYDLYGEKSEEKTQVTRKYSRLITRMRIVVNLGGDDNDPTQKDAVYMTRKNLNDACAKLSLNDLKFLEVRFCNGLTGHPSGRFRGVLYYGQTCLEPLKKLRAEKFIINWFASPSYAAELRAVIEGPKDANFLAGRQAKEDDEETEYDFWTEGEGEEEEDGGHQWA